LLKNSKYLIVIINADTSGRLTAERITLTGELTVLLYKRQLEQQGTPTSRDTRTGGNNINRRDVNINIGTAATSGTPGTSEAVTPTTVAAMQQKHGPLKQLGPKESQRQQYHKPQQSQKQQKRH
jgi:hypothetical protein